jgi:hypothetical protein
MASRWRTWPTPAPRERRPRAFNVVCRAHAGLPCAGLCCRAGLPAARRTAVREQAVRRT